MELKKHSKREGGFTLIELISVIVILGILAAVVVPKYADMTTQAKKGAAMGAVSEGISQFNLAYAQYTMANNKIPTGLADLYGGTSGGTTNPEYLKETAVSGDYTITYAAGGTLPANQPDGVEAVTVTAFLTGQEADTKNTKVIGVQWGS